MRFPAVFCLTVAVMAQPSSKQPDVDRIFSAFNTHTPGCAVGVAKDGKAALTAGYGMADLERNVAITADTVFESGSVAKQFTAAALILLAQQGKISLDDPMRKYLPELAGYGAPLTIRQVLSHVSGIREWRPIATFGGVPEGTFVYSNRDLLQMASQQKALNFDPGTNYSYSNTGYNISTILVERALGNGKTFQEFTHEAMFAPLGMTNTRWRDDFRAVVPNRALAYGRAASSSGWVQQTPIENIIGAGGLLTTVGDLLLWNENFTHAKVGGPEMVKLQQTPATLTSGRQISYAAGLTVSTYAGLREVAHSGSTGGYRTWLGRYPDQAVSVAVLCNAANANPAALGRETARLWTGAKAPAEIATAVRTPDAALAGMYRKVRDNTVSEIRIRDGKLVLSPGGAEFTATAEGKFVSGAGETRLEFEGAKRFRILTSTDDIHYERVEQANPTAAELAALAGKYESAETGTTVTIAPGARAGELSMRIASGAPLVLRPTFRDAFETPSRAAIRFIRDADGKVTALSAGEARVWDLRFTRLR